MRIIKYSCYVVDIKIEYFGGLKNIKTSKQLHNIRSWLYDYRLWVAYINFMRGEKPMMENRTTVRHEEENEKD